MQLTEGGFSLLEVLIAMTIGSVLLLSAARFLPALHAGKTSPAGWLLPGGV